MSTDELPYELLNSRPTIVIRAGLVHLTRPEYIFETTTWFNHPLYIDALQSVVQPNDIALLKFERFLPYTDYIKPIRLQSSGDMNKQYEGERLVASGWGRTWTNGALPEHLNWVYLLGVTNFQCSAAFGFNPIIVDSTICARGYNVSSQSTCQGDSGGPLTVIDEDGELSQVGVASFVSSSGCHTDVPAGFIRPGHYHDWITEITGLNFDVSRPDPTTETPEETTVVETTEAPEGTSTDGSQETTTAPIETTAAPIGTTAAPAETTAAPIETTAAPAESTAAPIETTSAPIETTSVPIETTAAPIGTPTAPIETTAAPIETTAAPAETTAAPIETTSAPIETTSVPIETTAAPIGTPTAPIETTAAPIETTAAPAETTAAPIETTSAPIETTSVPIETTAAPIGTPTAPIETTAAPIETTEGPVGTPTDIFEEINSVPEATLTGESLWSRLSPRNLFKFMY
ncbi:Lysostaphin [Eumeta japonica]|uniref:Lysostaphin n=1 Tax=Eumeta variegata TaxID=151549 RepID=A0A4C1XNR9_EUMVA|nr:Lysostaphin [Eumeta japonica]